MRIFSEKARKALKGDVILTERDVLLFLQTYINRKLSGQATDFLGEDYLLSRSADLISKLLDKDENNEEV